MKRLITTAMILAMVFALTVPAAAATHNKACQASDMNPARPPAAYAFETINNMAGNSMGYLPVQGDQIPPFDMDPAFWPRDTYNTWSAWYASYA